MHYTIEFRSLSRQFLHISARKPTLKHQLLNVEHGCILIKLGKNEYCLNDQQMFWIPANCLVSVTVLPNTQWHSIEVSQRSNQPFSKQSGYVKDSSGNLNLLSSLVSKLSKASLSDNIKRDYLKVLQHELLTLQPQLNSVVKILNDTVYAQFQQSCNQVDGLKVALTVRDCYKQMQSGAHLTKLCDQWYQGDRLKMQQDWLTMLGQPLTFSNK